MKSQFVIENKLVIDDIFHNAQYGTLALCSNNKPYSVPINFVKIEENIYFHGSKKGKKMKFIKDNSFASFSVVEPYSLIQSYFSSNDNLACPATHFFKSICCDGTISIVNDYNEKVLALNSLMKKLQPEGKYKSLDDDIYKKMINATEVFKLIPSELKGKIKLGQHLPKNRFDMIIEHLEKRGSDIDKLTIKSMKESL
ncbi:MAG TPA: pyridoxamine 5'-phosphate oxidase family protein [Bacteroidetes bacterium]|nr:pyridoxamine 5'-phosphate oxidase family protein [Bacteroidota bacterium]